MAVATTRRIMVYGSSIRLPNVFALPRARQRYLKENIVNTKNAAAASAQAGVHIYIRLEYAYRIRLWLAVFQRTRAGRYEEFREKSPWTVRKWVENQLSQRIASASPEKEIIDRARAQILPRNERN
jgi:hypothetical protein